MIEIEDTVMIKGEAANGEMLIIPGVICDVVDTKYTDDGELLVCVSPMESDFWIGHLWYRACNVEKGHEEWVKDE